MSRFLGWFNKTPEGDPVINAGIAHLWFVTVHPFDDGNGRIARAITDMSLARSEQSSQRFYSMSLLHPTEISFAEKVEVWSCPDIVKLVLKHASTLPIARTERSDAVFFRASFHARAYF